MQFGDLRVDVSETTTHVRLDWRGKSNARQPEIQLNPFLHDVSAKAQAGKLGIDMHFEELEFFNSSTITVIIQHVKELREKGVRLLVTYDRGQKWQKIFFDALSMFEKADGLLKIQAVAK
jgi:hypothetical protein